MPLDKEKRGPSPRRRTASRGPKPVGTPARDADYREIFHAIPVGLFRCAADGRLLDVNAALVELFGFPDQQGMCAVTLDTLFADPGAREAWLADIRVQGVACCPALRIRRYDGRYLWVRGFARALTGPGGTVLSIDGCLEDITAQQDAVVELAREQDLLHALMDSVPDTIYFKDTECRFTRINQAQARLLGVKRPGEAIGKTDFDFFAPVHAKMAFADDKTVMTTGIPITGKLEQARTRDGRAPWVSTTKVPVRALDGLIVGLVGITRDVTQQVLTAEALKEKERALSTLISNLPGMAYRCRNDAGRSMEFVSEGSLALTGFAPDLLIGQRARSYHQLIHPEDRDLVSSEVQAALQKQQSFQLTYRIVAADNDVRWVWEKGRGVYAASGEVVAIEGFISDVTENQRMQESLRESWEWLFTTLKSIGDAVIATDQDGNITFMNPVAEALTGWPEVEAVGCCCREVFCTISAATAATLPCPVTQVLRDGYPIDFASHSVLVARDGQKRMLAHSGAPIRNAVGRVTGAVLVFRDITEARRAEDERRNLELQMRHTQKLESLGILAGGIAHDFNNLLTGIMGHASLALGQMAADAEPRQNVVNIDHAAHRAADLCRQLLAYSGRGKFVIQPLDLSEVVQDMTELLHVSISKKICVQSRLEKNMPAVEADATQLRQIIMNLLTNAAEAIGDRTGTVVIATETLTVTHSLKKNNATSDDIHAGRYVQLVVHDNGCGMDEATFSRIFEPFFSTKFTGRGLGLSAVHGIVRSHHGVMQVESRPGQGTTFKVLFPASNKPVERLPRPEAAHPAGKAAKNSGTVLFVDDEEAVQMVARQVLERAGFTVIQARDGEEGVNLFRRHASVIAVVLLDLTMPRKSGSEAFAEMQAINPDIPVIFSSGYGEDEIVGSLPDRRMSGFISKPYRAATLVDKIREVLKKER